MRNIKICYVDNFDQQVSFLIEKPTEEIRGQLISFLVSNLPTMIAEAGENLHQMQSELKDIKKEVGKLS